MELEKYLKMHEGSRWTFEDTQYVLTQAAIDKSEMRQVAENYTEEQVA